MGRGGYKGKGGKEKSPKGGSKDWGPPGKKSKGGKADGEGKGQCRKRTWPETTRDWALSRPNRPSGMEGMVTYEEAERVWIEWSEGCELTETRSTATTTRAASSIGADCGTRSSGSTWGDPRWIPRRESSG